MLFIQTRLLGKDTAGQPESPLSLQEVLALCQGAETQLINSGSRGSRELTTGLCYQIGCCWQVELGACHPVQEVCVRFCLVLPKISFISLHSFGVAILFKPDLSAM